MIGRAAVLVALLAMAAASVLSVPICASPRAGEGIPFQVVGQGIQPLNYPHVVVFRNQEDWEASWRQINPLRTVPEVDFGRQVAILYRLGCRGSAGHSLAVDCLSIRGGTMYVDVTETQPGAGCMVPPTLTCPFVVISTIHWPHEVEANLRQVVKDCIP